MILDHPPQKSPQGLWIVKRTENFSAWDAWSTWYRYALGKKFLPDTLTTWGDYPPETPAGADYIAAKTNEIRSKLKPPWGVSVPEHPQPWTPFPANIRAERLQAARDEERMEPRMSQEAITATVTKARNRYGRFFQRASTP